MIKCHQNLVKLVFAVICFMLVSLCSASTDITRQFNPEDPYEPFNRVMFNMNDRLDKAILKPISKFYNQVMPKPVSKGISNIFSNLDTIPTLANDLLQAHFYQASNDAWRLAVNTTAGVGGIFDVASHIGLEPNSEDFGLTLARWGFKDSNYLVLPFFGPSTVRDAIGMPINYHFLSVYPYITPTRARYGVYALNVVSKRAHILRYQDVLQQAAIDRYAFMRNAYLQRRNYLIERNIEINDLRFDKAAGNLENAPLNPTSRPI